MAARESQLPRESRPATRLSVRLTSYPSCLRRSRNFLRVAPATRILCATRFLSTRVGPMRLIPVAPTRYAFMITYILGIRSCLITRHNYREVRKVCRPATSSGYGTHSRVSLVSLTKTASGAEMLQLLRNGPYVQGLSPTPDRTYEADPRHQDSSDL